MAYVSSIHDLLFNEGYRLIDDAWAEHGRRTYIHDDDASRPYIKGLTVKLRSAGWDLNTDQLRSFQHAATGDIIELEPGGADTTGHFLHHMKPL